MLNAETPFPNPGSYALTLDPVSGLDAGRVELVRILRHPQAVRGTAEDGAQVLVTFPLRDGASGTRTVPFAELIDATPLTGAEGREMIDLDRELRSKPLRDRAKKQARHDALRQRAIWASRIRLLLAEAARREAKRRGTVGEGGRATRGRAA